MTKFSKVIAASDLLGGNAIWWATDDRWSDRHADARLFTDKAEAEDALEAAEGDPYVIGPYLAEARPGPDGPEPVHFREAFRTTGPTCARAPLRPVEAPDA